jgi:hypothetical protein
MNMETNSVHISNLNSCLSYGDAASMHVQNKRLAASRRSPAPEWIADPEKTRRVLVCYLEKRAAKASTGTLAERLKAANALCILNSKAKLRSLNKLCREYQKTQNPDRRRRLEIQIRNLDADIFATKRGVAALVLRAAFLYWRSGLSSPEVALELGRPVHPVCVRQWLCRLNKLAKKQFGYV